MKKSTKVLLLVAALVVCGLVAAWLLLSPGASAGAKTITVQVTHSDGQTAKFKIKTDEAYLAPALLAENRIAGDQSDYGLFIHTVDGEFADSEKSQWWVFTVNGEIGNYGADAQPIADGDVFAFSIYAE